MNIRFSGIFKEVRVDQASPPFVTSQALHGKAQEISSGLNNGAVKINLQTWTNGVTFAPYANNQGCRDEVVRADAQLKQWLGEHGLEERKHYQYSQKIPRR